LTLQSNLEYRYTSDRVTQEVLLSGSAGVAVLLPSPPRHRAAASLSRDSIQAVRNR
jgi:hypothetical protein